MTVPATIPLHIYAPAEPGARGRVLGADKNLEILAKTLDAWAKTKADLEAKSRRETVVLTAGPDGTLQPKSTVVVVPVPELPPPTIPKAVLAQYRSTRPIRVDEATGEVFVLECQQNPKPTWLRLLPVFVNGQFRGLIDSKGKDVRVEVKE